MRLVVLSVVVAAVSVLIDPGLELELVGVVLGVTRIPIPLLQQTIGVCRRP